MIEVLKPARPTVPRGRRQYSSPSLNGWPARHWWHALAQHRGCDPIRHVAVTAREAAELAGELRVDPEDVENEVSFQSSPDAGKTFTPPILRLSDRAFDSRIGFGSERDMPDLGNRLALLSTEDRALAVGSDTRAGTDASRKQDVVRAVVAIPQEDEAEVALSWGLGAAAAVFAIAALCLIVPRPRQRSFAGD